ncbi:MAG: hypothetical protein ACM336_19280 [Acidobacteriota bacterium]
MKQVVWIVSTALMICLVVFLWHVQRQDVELRALLHKGSAVQPSADGPVPLPADLLSVLRTPNAFQVRRTVSDIPAAVRVAFAKVTNEDEFLMAESGARWQAGCVGEPGLPRRRLARVAIGGSFCLVFYERGGVARTDDVAAFRLFRDRAEPVWHAYRGAHVKDPAALLAALEADKSITGDKLFF